VPTPCAAPVQVGQDLPVHLHQPQLPVRGGGSQQPPGLLARLTVPVQERRVVMNTEQVKQASLNLTT
jgi:hypothetical protein